MKISKWNYFPTEFLASRYQKLFVGKSCKSLSGKTTQSKTFLEKSEKKFHPLWIRPNPGCRIPDSRGWIYQVDRKTWCQGSIVVPLKTHPNNAGYNKNKYWWRHNNYIYFVVFCHIFHKKKVNHAHCSCTKRRENVVWRHNYSWLLTLKLSPLFGFVSARVSFFSWAPPPWLWL